MNAHKARSVLIVEDERIVAKDIQQTLIRLGYDAFAIASTADEAIGRATERCPDIVLMDIRIKGDRDGIETADILRRRFGIPVVFLTAHADETTLERAKLTEPYGYLMKPVKGAELRSALEMGVYRHEIEKRWRERERWFSTTLTSIADAVISVDLAGHVTFMNPAAEVLTGMKVSEAIGRLARDVVRLTEPSVDASQATPIERALQTREIVHVPEAELKGSGRENRTISDSAAPVFDDGQLLGAVMVFRDITEQKVLQKQVELSDRLSSLGTMAAGVAHEINNPLAVIVANAAFVSDELKRLQAEPPRHAELGGGSESATGERAREAIAAQADLQIAAGQIGTIVRDLKAFSRPSRPASRRADVGRAIDWAVRATANELRHRARVSTRVGELPPVDADETRLVQVLVNLLINAAEAIAPGDVEQNEVSLVAGLEEKRGRVFIEVRDTGHGMPSDVAKRIFEPFFTTKAADGGTGLGLSICHGIVKSLGGEMQVESELGKGSVFRVLLSPAAGEEVASERSLPRQAEYPRGRILVLDDEPLVLQAIKRILRGHDVVCAETAKGALELVESGEHFDLILSDVMMPMMTGIEFYEALLGRDPDLARGMVFLSGGAVTAKVGDFLQAVPNVRIGKPFEVDEIRDAVRQGLWQGAVQGKPSTSEA